MSRWGWVRLYGLIAAETVCLVPLYVRTIYREARRRLAA